MGLESLAPLTVDLYNKALAAKSKAIYKTGANHFRKFAIQFPNLNTIPLPCPAPSASTLVLCFFAASLCLKSSINSAKTIKSYIRHIKDYWIQMGCDPLCFESDILDRVLKGVNRRYPPKRDTRPAFLLPHYHFPLWFRHPSSAHLCTVTAAIIFGFFGMVRFHVFKKLRLKNLVLVGVRGREYTLWRFPPHTQKSLVFSNKIIGFYFNVSDKNNPAARVFLAKVSDTHPKWKPICPLRALRLLWVHDLFKSIPFSNSRLTQADLNNAMQKIDGNLKNFKSHCLRIGAETFFLTYGLPETFVEFLQRRKTPRVALIYYRASPRLTIYLIRQFAKTFSSF